MVNAIETHNLTKQYPKRRGWRRLAHADRVTVVNEVTLSVPTGEFFGLLGPNGAGKTTLVKMLCTLVLPTSGTAQIAGYSLQKAAEIRAAVGLVVTDERSFYWRLTGRENLMFFAAMHHLFGSTARRRVDEVLEAVEMRPWAEKRISDYSTGMRQRLAIARSLLHGPEILFLDEPSRSLDPTATGRLHTLLRRLVSESRVTIFLITHDLAEAEKLCDRVAVMHAGRIRTVGRPSELRGQLARNLRYTVRVDRIPSGVEATLRAMMPGLELKGADDARRLVFRAAESDGALTELLDILRENDVTIFSIEGTPPTLEQVFAHYTRSDEV